MGTSIFDSILKDMPEECKQTNSMSYHDYALKQCEWYNESTGDLDISDGYDCAECKNRGYFQVLDGEDNKVMRPCRCQKVRTFIRTMQASGLGDLYRKCTFDRYTVGNEWQRECKETALNYAKSDTKEWLYFAGQSGCGKTHLCTAICSYLARHGNGIVYAQWKRLYDKLVQTRYKEAEYSRTLKSVIEADILYIDDFLKMPRNVQPTDDMLSIALEIVDARYKSSARTLFSTEYSIEQIITFDEALGGRILERARKNTIQVSRGSDRNYRKKE